MDESSFIAQQLADFRDRAEFEPFEIVLLNSQRLAVTHPVILTNLSGGLLFREQDGSYLVVPYDKILFIQTIFDL